MKREQGGRDVAFDDGVRDKRTQLAANWGSSGLLRKVSGVRLLREAGATRRQHHQHQQQQAATPWTAPRHTHTACTQHHSNPPGPGRLQSGGWRLLLPESDHTPPPLIRLRPCAASSAAVLPRRPASGPSRWGGPGCGRSHGSWRALECGQGQVGVRDGGVGSRRSECLCDQQLHKNCDKQSVATRTTIDTWQ